MAGTLKQVKMIVEMPTDAALETLPPPFRFKKTLRTSRTHLIFWVKVHQTAAYFCNRTEQPFSFYLTEA